MSDDPFFNLKGDFKEFDEVAFDNSLKTSKHIWNVQYSPDALKSKNIVGKKFENVSFSKTELCEVTFKECEFIDCLFIGTAFFDTGFHSCAFKRCNFYKSRFSHVYGKPEQFVAAIPNDQYANIGVHLYQELRDNYADEAQPEFMREAEYQFKKWSQKLLWSEIRRAGKISWNKLAKWLFLAGYKLTFGYGLRLRNLVFTTVVSVLVLTIFARLYAAGMFVEEMSVTWVKGVYFTVSTMITLGAIGFTPKSDAGYLFLLLNAVVGVVLLSATLNAFSKRVSR